MRPRRQAAVSGDLMVREALPIEEAHGARVGPPCRWPRLVQEGTGVDERLGKLAEWCPFRGTGAVTAHKNRRGVQSIDTH